MYKKIINIIVLMIMIIISTLNEMQTVKASENIIPEGVYIENINVGGLTENEAYKAINDYIKNQGNKLVIVKYNNNKFSFTLNNIGYTYINNNYLQQALKIGKTGNLINRYKSIKDVYYNNIHYSLEYTLDKEMLIKILEENLSPYNISPINASMYKSGEKIIYTNHVNGEEINITKTANKIIEEIINNKNQKNYVINAYIDEVSPICTIEDIKKCNNIIGSYSTSYKTSLEGRSANLSNGARLINNSVIYPGEIFSTYEKLGPFTSENGYYEASAFYQGKVVDSIGGGACQVTSTLYNAVLMAELEIIERYPHSMIVSYVDLSRDAAIAEYYKDFKFKNNTNTPILIEAYMNNKELIINIWGYESRDIENRHIKYETKIISELPPPPDIITFDDTKPKSYKKVIQTARKGYETELYKIIYENNVEVRRVLVNKSIYKPSARHIVIGTK